MKPKQSLNRKKNTQQKAHMINEASFRIMNLVAKKTIPTKRNAILKRYGTLVTSYAAKWSSCMFLTPRQFEEYSLRSMLPVWNEKSGIFGLKIKIAPVIYLTELQNETNTPSE